jgi:glycosyltransferase involved in cell wall biosynthesis
MPVHNGARHLPEALGSIAAQTWGAFELVVVDDGSTDDTPAILAEMAVRDDRLTILRQSHQGLTAALTCALAASTGEYVARHDADDVSTPTRFERQLAYLRAHGRVAAVGGGAVAIDDAGAEVRVLPNRTGPAAVRDGLRTLKATPVHGAMMMRRASLDEVGGYRAAFRAAQDFDLWLRLADRYDLDNLPDTVYRWRLRQDGVYTTRRAAQLMYAGIALTFAVERDTTGTDSYALLQECDGDLEGFSRAYRLRGSLEAVWGELLFRGLDDPRVARRHFGAAIRAGHRGARALGLYAWSLCGLPWPGGPQLQAPPAPSSVDRSNQS